MRSDDYILVKVIETKGSTEVFIEDSANLISALLVKVNKAVDEANKNGYMVNWINCVYATKQVCISNADEVVTYSIISVSRAKVEGFPIWGVYDE